MDIAKRLNQPVVQKIIVLALLALFIGFAFWGNAGQTLTTDEQRHYQYGINILDGNSERFDDSKMPITALNAIPQKLASYLPESGLKDVLNELHTARLVTILFSAFVALLIFHWARSLYGFMPGLFALILYIFDPNITAHSQLITTDIYAAGTITFACYCLWRFAHDRTWKNGLLCALALGLSQIAKYTAVPLFLLFLGMLLLYDLPKLIESYKLNKLKTLKTCFLRYAGYILVSVCVAILVINIGFLSRNSFTRFGEYKLRSGIFKTLQADVPLLRKIPVPTAYPYLQGFDWITQRSTGVFPIYLLGRVQNGRGFPGYYFVASLLKEPIATQIIVMAALVAYFLSRQRRQRFLSDELFLFVPIVFFATYFNFFYNVQIGIRYYLVIFPLVFILAGSLFTGWAEFSTFQKSTALVLCVYLVVSVFSYYPYSLPYFNELVWDRTQSYQYLADSNIDWGQSKNELNTYLAAHPDTTSAPNTMQPGKFVISPNALVGLDHPRAQYAWLRDHFKPIGTIAYTYLIYNISAADIEKVCANIKCPANQ